MLSSVLYFSNLVVFAALLQLVLSMRVLMMMPMSAPLDSDPPSVIAVAGCTASVRERDPLRRNMLISLSIKNKNTKYKNQTRGMFVFSLSLSVSLSLSPTNRQ